MRLPASVKERPRPELAASDPASLNPFIAAAVDEKVWRRCTASEFLRERAGRSRRTCSSAFAARRRCRRLPRIGRNDVKRAPEARERWLRPPRIREFRFL